MFSTLDARQAFEFCRKFYDSKNDSGHSIVSNNLVSQQEENWFYIEEIEESELIVSYNIFSKYFVLHVISRTVIEGLDVDSTKCTTGTWSRELEAYNVAYQYSSYAHVEETKIKDTQIELWLSTQYLNNL